MSNKVDQILKNIAKDELGLETLELRNSNSLDFHDLSVSEIKKALLEAFKAGFELGKAK